MAQGDILQVKFKFNVAREPAAFTLHYEVLNSGVGNTDDSCVGLNTLLFSTDIAGLPTHLAEDVYFEGWTVRFLRGTDAFPPQSTQLTSGTGQRTGEAIPLVSSMVVRLVQDTRDAKFNGRIFMPGISENDTTQGRITQTTVLDGILEDLNDVILVSGNVSGIDWAFQEVINGGSKASGYTETPVVRYQINPIIGSSRKRITREFGYFQ